MLIIISLIVGGIVGGKNLIRNAELQSVVSDFSKYKTAVNTFELQYDALPGDIRDAWDYWGTDCHTNANACNGDGDGAITWNQEAHRIWQHLSLVQIISGAYTGEVGIGSQAGINIPASKIKNAGFGLYYSVQSGDSFGTGLKNRILFGIERLGNDSNQKPVLTPAETKRLDNKMDDGVGNTGKVIGNIGTPDNEGICAVVGVYQVSNNGIACKMLMTVD